MFIKVFILKSALDTDPRNYSTIPHTCMHMHVHTGGWATWEHNASGPIYLTDRGMKLQKHIHDTEKVISN